MTEENINQPVTPPNDYQNHLIWRNIFIYMILPIQFVGNLSVLYQHIINFNDYYIGYVIMVLFASIVTLISIPIVFFASIKKRPIGYKTIWVYSIFLIIYKIYSFLIIYLYYIPTIKQIDPNLANELVSNYLFSDVISVIGFTLVAIINLIYFSQRKFLFGIYPEEPAIPVSEQEQKSKENNQ